MRRAARPSGAPKVRPTTGKVLESLLAILAPDIEGADAIDLFAGTGKVGMGLLKKGAKSVMFVEADHRVAKDLRRATTETPGVESKRCAFLIGRIPNVLERLKGPYLLFLADPPYDWDQTADLLPALGPLAAPGAILVVEHHHKTPYDDGAGWKQFRQKKQGETRLTFFRMAEAAESEEHSLSSVDEPSQAGDGRHDRHEDGEGS